MEKKIYREAAQDSKESFYSWCLTEKSEHSFATFADSLSGRFSFIGYGGFTVLFHACSCYGVKFFLKDH
jgi:hypothetical protein